MSDAAPHPHALALPPLPLEGWADTRTTLHLVLQLVGRIRLAASPPQNHSWDATLRVTPRGLTTGPLQHAGRSFQLDVDLATHALRIVTGAGDEHAVPLQGASVADVYDRLSGALELLGVAVPIRAVPYDIAVMTPFAEDHEHASWDLEAIGRYRTILVWVDGVFREYAGRFTGKESPVQLFWHSLDLAVTRFSGRRAPARPGADAVTADAYSHEVISCGWWAGDERVPAPAFYSYTAPAPDGLSDRPLRPAAAGWQDVGGSPMALLPYEAVRMADDPRATALEFLESAYAAGAAATRWDVEELAYRPHRRWDATHRPSTGGS